MRDLYNCSWKVRVPKMLPANQGTGSPHPNARLWRAMEAMQLQPGGESIHALLDETIKNRITVRDLWVEVCWTYYILITHLSCITKSILSV